MKRIAIAPISRALTAMLAGLGLAVMATFAAASAADGEPPAPKVDPKPQPLPLPTPPAAEPPVVPPAEPPVEVAPQPDPKLEDGLYAKIETNRGTIFCRLFHDKAIRTVENFVTLAEGTRTWTDPTTKKEMAKTPFFDGLKFHRVEPEFVVQTGDPLNTGEGGPGYTMPDEYYPELRFDKPGMLGMARTERPNTAGSQFFITLAPISQLNDHYTVFGEVVAGLDVAGKLAKGDTMKKVTVLRIGDAAQKFDFAAATQERVKSLTKALPDKIGEADAARVPGAGQPASDEIVVRGCMIVYKGSMLETAYTTRTKEEAKALAEKIVSLARAKDIDTAKVLAEYTEVPADHPMHMQKGQLPPSFESVFSLKMGQVTDPLDAPMGYIIFSRVEPVIYHASHILIQYKGSARATTERTKDEAKKLAEDLRVQIVDKKADFATLAKENSDDPTTKATGGDLGEWEAGEMVPQFDDATEKLKVDEISGVVETPFGFHIIKRLALAPKPVLPTPLPMPGGIELPTPVPAPAPLPAPAPAEKPQPVPQPAPLPAPAPAPGN